MFSVYPVERRALLLPREPAQGPALCRCTDWQAG